VKLKFDYYEKERGFEGIIVHDLYITNEDTEYVVYASIMNESKEKMFNKLITDCDKQIELYQAIKAEAERECGE
jgi:hypothetical protein